MYLEARCAAAIDNINSNASASVTTCYCTYTNILHCSVESNKNQACPITPCEFRPHPLPSA